MDSHFNASSKGLKPARKAAKKKAQNGCLWGEKGHVPSSQKAQKHSSSTNTITRGGGEAPKKKTSQERTFWQKPAWTQPEQSGTNHWFEIVDGKCGDHKVW